MEEKSCGELIKIIHCAMQKNANNELRSRDLTFAQVHLLFTLERQPEGACLMKALERKMGVAQSTVAGVVKRCGEKGLVEYRDDPEDRRAKYVRITEKGRQVCRDTEENIRLSEARIVRSLPDGEYDTLTALLQKVYTAVSQPAE